MERLLVFTTEILTTVKVAINPKVTYRFNTISVLILAHCFVLFAEIDMLNLKFTWKFKGLILFQVETISKKSKVGGLLFPDFETYYKATVIKTAWY